MEKSVEEAIWSGRAYVDGSLIVGVCAARHDGVPDQNLLRQAIDGWIDGCGRPPTNFIE